LDLTVLASSPQTEPVFNQAPVVIGMQPRSESKIEIHSDTEITQTVTADASGNFELDVSQFQNLSQVNMVLIVILIQLPVKRCLRLKPLLWLLQVGRVNN
jgi:hypothetical protein